MRKRTNIGSRSTLGKSPSLGAAFRHELNFGAGNFFPLPPIWLTMNEHFSGKRLCCWLNYWCVSAFKSMGRYPACGVMAYRFRLGHIPDDSLSDAVEEMFANTAPTRLPTAAYYVLFWLAVGAATAALCGPAKVWSLAHEGWTCRSACPRRSECLAAHST